MNTIYFTLKLWKGKKMNFKKDFCQHKMKVLQVERFDDLIEKIGKNNYMTLWPDDRKALTKRGIIVVTKCKKCGKIETKKEVL